MGCIVYTDYVYSAFVLLLVNISCLAFHTNDESLQASPNCTLVAYDYTSMYTNMEFSELKPAVIDVLQQAVSCPGLNNSPKYIPQNTT